MTEEAKSGYLRNLQDVIASSPLLTPPAVAHAMSPCAIEPSADLA
ncbi:hypothetical protein [Streptomyces sp. NPDC048560]